MINKSRFIEELIREKIKGYIIDAFGSLDQGFFFDSLFKDRFYGREAVPIGCGESSDEPFALAKMINYLMPKSGWRILEVGTGSGYSTCLLSMMTSEVVTIEYNEELAASAKKRFSRLKRNNIRSFVGDGTGLNGLPGEFDAAIILSACQKRPLSIIDYLKKSGVMVFPMGTVLQQQIAILKNEHSAAGEGLFATEFKEMCTFAPIRGQYGILQPDHSLSGL